MGLRGLETYLEKSSSACYTVSLPDIVRKYREETGLDPVILMDGPCCGRPLYRNMNWLTGGQFKQALHQIDSFIDIFTRLGCQLAVFFTGPGEDLPSRVKSRRDWLERADRQSKLFTSLEEGLSTKLLEEENYRCEGMPCGLICLFMYALSRHHNCSILHLSSGISGRPRVISEYAVKHKCLAILAQNSEYVIYRAAPYYLSMKNFNFEDLTTLCYDGTKLASELGFSEDRLPLFAALLGNAEVKFNLLEDFHLYLRRKWKGYPRVKLVARYISDLTTLDLPLIANKVFGKPADSDLLEKSFLRYDLSTSPQRKEKAVSDENWQKVTSLAVKKYQESCYNDYLYDIVVHSIFYSASYFEDLSPSRVILPIGTLLKELRRAIYGILIKEKPLDEGTQTNFITEEVLTDYNTYGIHAQVEPKYLVKVEHPGLVELWTSQEENVKELRWEILAEVFRTDADRLRQLPPYFLVPVLATRYFKGEYDELKDWEVDALISTNVCVRCYEWDQLSELPTDPLTYRQIWIYSAILAIYATVSHLLFYIGEPIPFQHTVVHQYTDGKLFHEKYRQASKHCPLEKLCDNKDENMKMFHQLKSVAVE